jgi:hypothetical protein
MHSTKRPNLKQRPTLRRSPSDPRPPATTELLQAVGARRLDPHRELRGHDFFPPIPELAEVPSIIDARTTPPAERLLLVHYFTTYCDWFVAGFDPRTGIAYGYTDDPELGLSMWGRFDLNALCSLVIPTDPPVVVWRDEEWRPLPADAALLQHRRAG